MIRKIKNEYNGACRCSKWIQGDKDAAHYDSGITMVNDTANNKYMISTSSPDTEKYYVLIKLTSNGES